MYLDVAYLRRSGDTFKPNQYHTKDVQIENMLSMWRCTLNVKFRGQSKRWHKTYSAFTVDL